MGWPWKKKPSKKWPPKPTKPGFVLALMVGGPRDGDAIYISEDTERISVPAPSPTWMFTHTYHRQTLREMAPGPGGVPIELIYAVLVWEHLAPGSLLFTILRGYQGAQNVNNN